MTEEQRAKKAERARRYYKRHREEILERKRKKYQAQAHSKDVHAKRREYYLKNRERILERARQRYREKQAKKKPPAPS